MKMMPPQIEVELIKIEMKSELDLMTVNAGSLLRSRTFDRTCLCKRNPWHRAVIKGKYYYRNALFSSIQLLF